MNSDIMVSVYCLAYNHEQYIRTALEGFVTQKTKFKFEVIVHDDASTDGTADIIREYEQKYPHIIKPIYQTENQYSKKVRIFDTFIKDKIQGKYIAVCEGDDYWTDENKLQMQVDILENNSQYTACVHQTQKLNCKTGEKTNCSPLNQDGEVLLQDVLSKNIFQTSSIVFRREFRENVPDYFKAVKSVGDYRLFVHLAFCGDIYYINKTMSVYRYFSGATSWTSRFNYSYKRTVKYRKERIQMLKMADEYYEHKYHDIIENAIAIEEYRLLKFTWNKEIVKNKKYCDLFRKEPLKKRIKMIIQTHMPTAIKDKYFEKKYSDYSKEEIKC